MSVIYVGALQTARLTAVKDAIDINALAATIEIGTTAFGSTLVSITMSKPSFSVAGSPPGVAMTMALPPKSGVAGATGTAAAGRIKDGGGNIIVSGLTVGVGTGDIQLNSTSITSGQTVTITSAVITHPNT